MNENLPVHVDQDLKVGSITYANEVIAIIAGMAANEVEGVAQMVNTSSIADLFVKPKPVTKGVKVEVGSEEASVDLVLTVEYGKPIQKVCTEVQEGVRKSIETMTGLHVVKVDVHVVGVSFEKETQEMQKGYFKATQQEAIPQETAARPPMQPEDAEEDADDIDVEIPEGDDTGEEETEEEAAGDYAAEEEVKTETEEE